MITHLKHLLRTKKKRVVILENIVGDSLQKTSDLVDWKQAMEVLFLFKNKNLFTFVSNDFGEVLYKPECTYVFSKTIFDTNVSIYI
jgi:hypothetical protein